VPYWMDGLRDKFLVNEISARVIGWMKKLFPKLMEIMSCWMGGLRD
jgi:hypothetical protein